jgi:hypothetical protein
MVVKRKAEENKKKKQRPAFITQLVVLVHLYAQETKLLRLYLFSIDLLNPRSLVEISSD